jgi:hypothetical protein
MKTYRALFSPLVLPFFVAIAGGLAAGSSPCALGAPIDGGVSTISLPIKGIVDGLPERIDVSGKVAIQSTISLDPVFFTPATVMLRIRFVNVTGKGMTTGLTYTTGANEDQMIRPLPTVSDEFIQVNFPLWVIKNGMFSARPGLASLTLKFSKTTGEIMGGAASVSTPPDPGF